MDSTNGTRRWMVTGCFGQLGRCLVRDLESLPGEALVAASDVDTLDIADLAAVRAQVETCRPQVLANAAAFNAVDAAEKDDRTALQVNEAGPANLARVCAEAGVLLVHVSTDYVFDGRGSRPYREDDPTGPNTAYGRSKLAGEERVLASDAEHIVVRTSWVFGPGKNFVGAILKQAELRRLGAVQGPLSVVDDQLGCPTYAQDLADGLRALVSADARGLFQLSNAEPVTWWGFARGILDESGFSELAIDKATTASLGLPAPRPAYSVMDCAKAARHGVALRPWREALVAFLQSADGEALRAEARSEAEASAGAAASGSAS